MSEEGFAARWSRRKRGGTAAKAPDPELPLEEPPVLDSLGLDEIGPWLKRRVPEAWKTAALRRVWVADPAIRDFVGLADYAWDWNTPGGAPFYGPLQAVDDVAELFARAMGTRPADPPAAQSGEPSVQTPVEASGDAAPRLVVEEAPDLPPPATVTEDEPEPMPPRRRGGGATPA